MLIKEQEGNPVLSNQILHKAVQDIKRITGLECAIWDIKGICLVMTNERMTGLESEVMKFCKVSDLTGLLQYFARRRLP